MPGQVLPGDCALEQPGRAGEEADLVERRGQLLGRVSPSGLPVFSHSAREDLLGPRLERVGELAAARAAARSAWCRATTRTPSRRPPVRGVDVLGAGDRGGAEDLAGGRVDRGRPVGRRRRRRALPLMKFCTVRMALLSGRGSAAGIDARRSGEGGAARELDVVAGTTPSPERPPVGRALKK